MPVASLSPGQEMVKKTGDTRHLLARLGQDLRGEKWTDVVLYSRERIPLPVHRLVLSQSRFLDRILRSHSCCGGVCSQQETLSLLLPDVCYQHLVRLVTFLYTGSLQCSLQDKPHLLVRKLYIHN